MSTWKSPPKAKIYEALSAVAGGRVTLMGGEKAEVVSSDGTKTYHVEWSPDLNQITSNDNASYWQGYMGYPIIAVLMVLGKLEYRTEVADFLAGCTLETDESAVSQRLHQGDRLGPRHIGG